MEVLSGIVQFMRDLGCRAELYAAGYKSKRVTPYGVDEVSHPDPFVMVRYPGTKGAIRCDLVDGKLWLRYAYDDQFMPPLQTPVVFGREARVVDLVIPGSLGKVTAFVSRHFRPLNIELRGGISQ